MLTSQGFWVTQDPVQGFSGDLLEGLIGRGQERELAITFKHGVEPGCGHGSLQGGERMKGSLKALGCSADGLAGPPPKAPDSCRTQDEGKKPKLTSHLGLQGPCQA